MTNLTPTPANGNFNDLLYNFLKSPGIEAFENFVYTDSVGLPTIGVGYLLLTQVGKKWAPIDLTTLQSVMHLSSVQLQTLKNDLSQAANAKNGVSGSKNPFPVWKAGISDTANILDWSMTAEQSHSLFNIISPTYLSRLKTWLNNDILYNSLLGSKEMLALMSLTYNGFMGVSQSGTRGSPQLYKAISNGNRAEAWYQIRYETASPATRNYAQSAMFGLYDANTPITEDVAKDVYRVYTKHADLINQYEVQNQGKISEAQNILNKVFSSTVPIVGSLKGADSNGTGSFLKPSGEILLQLYGHGQQVPYYNIRLGNVSGGLVSGDLTSNTLLIGDKGSDVLKGHGWDDVLIGGGGTDTMEGGTGNDMYVFTPQDGQLGVEKITDLDGQGSIVVGNTQLTGETPDKKVTIVSSSDRDLTWTDNKATYHFIAKAANSSTGTLEITGGILGSNADDKIIINDFDFGKALTNPNGYLGIHMKSFISVAKGNQSNTSITSSYLPGKTYDPLPGAYTFTVNISNVSDLVQQVSIAMTQGDSSGFAINTDTGIVEFTGGAATINVAAGQSSVTFGLINISDVLQDESIKFTATLVDPNASSDATPITSDPFEVDYLASPHLSTTSPTIDRTITGDLKPINFGTDATPFYHYDDLGNVEINPEQSDPGRDDVLFGGTGNDVINAGDGKNVIIAGKGNNTVVGGGDYDHITAGDGDNVISGHGGQDIILAGNGNNKIYADSKVDFDTAIQQAKNAKGTGQSGSFISALNGDNTIVGGNDNDAIMVGNGNNFLILGGGNTTVFGGVKVPSVQPDWTASVVYDRVTKGPFGNDIIGIDFENAEVLSAGGYTPSAKLLELEHTYPYSGFLTNVSVTPYGEGSETIIGGNGSYYIEGGNGNGYITLGNGASTVFAGAGNYTIIGGGSGSNLVGGVGDDYILAGSGDEFIIGTSGNNTIIGGTGNDTIIAGVSAGLTSATLSLNAGNNYVEAGSGNTLIYGSGGDDTLVAGSGVDTIYAGYGNTTIYGGTGGSYLIGGANTLIQSGSGNDTIYGNNGLNTIYGGSGNDLIYSGSNGDDWADFGNQSRYIEAGSGDTTIYGSGATDYIHAGSGQDVIHAGNGTEFLYGGSGSDTIYGGSGTNTFYGGYGADSMVGGSGQNNFIAGGGNSTLVGGSGINQYQLGVGFGSVEIDPSNGIDGIQFGAGIAFTDLSVSAAFAADGTPGLSIQDANGDTVIIKGGLDGVLDKFQFADGSIFNFTQFIAQVATSDTQTAGVSGDLLFTTTQGDTLVGGTGNDTIYAWSANDTIIAGPGNNTFVVNYGGTDIQVAPGSGNNTVISSVNFVLPANVQNLTLRGSGLKGIGNDLNNALSTNGNNDTLISGAGIDTLNGAGLNDTFFVNNASDVVNEQANQNNNSIISSVSYVLPDHVQNLTLTGDHLIGTGNDLSNQLVATGNNDTLVAGTGLATMTGSGQNDTFVVNNVSDVVTEQANNTNNTIISSVSYTLSQNVQNLVLTGSDNLTAVGNNLLNTTITANSGNDTLQGGTGSGNLIGGSGQDTFVLGLNTGSFVVTKQSNTTAIAQLAQGVDFSDLTAVKQGNDLLLQIAGTQTSNSLLLQNYFTEPQNWALKDYNGNTISAQTLMDATNALESNRASQLEAQYIHQLKADFAKEYSLYATLQPDGSYTYRTGPSSTNNNASFVTRFSLTYTPRPADAPPPIYVDPNNAFQTRITQVEYNIGYSSDSATEYYISHPSVTFSKYNYHLQQVTIDSSDALITSNYNTNVPSGSGLPNGLTSITTNGWANVAWQLTSKETLVNNKRVNTNNRLSTFQFYNFVPGTTEIDQYGYAQGLVGGFQAGSQPTQPVSPTGSYQEQLAYFSSNRPESATLTTVDSTKTIATYLLSAGDHRLNGTGDMIIVDARADGNDIISNVGYVATGSGNDTISFANTVFTGSGNNSINDVGTVYLGSGNNTVNGAQTVYSGSGDNIINAHVVYGGSGNDQISADGAIGSKVYAGSGNDTLNGSAGHALLVGGSGVNTFIATGYGPSAQGASGDTLVGGSGANSFELDIQSGLITIDDTASANNGHASTDIIHFDAGVTAADVRIQQHQNDLLLSYGGVGKVLTLKNFNLAGVTNSAPGMIQFADGSYISFETNADRSYIYTIQDAQNNTSSKSFTSAGVLTGQAWSYADGSYGNYVISADGSKTGENHHADGSFDTTSTDGDGNLTIQYYDVNGFLIRYSISSSDGHGGMTTHYFDENSTETNYSIVTSNTNGGTTTKNYLISGILTDDAWTKNDGSHGSDIFNADGSSSGATYNRDGSYSVYTDDGLGNINTTYYDAHDVETAYAIAVIDATGNGNSHTYSIDNVEIAHSTTTKDAHGNSLTKNYDGITGDLTSDHWVNTDGSYGNDTYNSDGTSFGNTYLADGSYSTHTLNAAGITKTYYYDSLGLGTGYTSASEDQYGVVTTVSFDANGIETGYVQSTNDGHGYTNTFNYSITGTLLSGVAVQDDGQGNITTSYSNAQNFKVRDTWIKSDGSYGSNSYQNGLAIGGDTHNPDGSYSNFTATSTLDVNNLVDYIVTTHYYSALGTDNGYEIAENHPDGSFSSSNYTADGSHITYQRDNVGNSTETRFDSTGAETGYTTVVYDANRNQVQDNFSAANVLLSEFYFDIDGSSTGTFYNDDGSYTTSNADGHGNQNQYTYNISGILLSDTWTKSDGTFGSETFNSDGSSTAISNYVDGSYTTSVNNGQGEITSTSYDASGAETGHTVTNSSTNAQITSSSADSAITIQTTAIAGNDILTGGTGNDTLSSGTGNDTLAGGAGNDTYVFQTGSGVDHIQDTSGTNTIDFGTGLTSDNLTLGLGSLLIKVGSNGDAIHLDDFDPNHVENGADVTLFTFANGSTLTYADLIARGFDLNGTAGDDLIHGTNVNDRFNGLAGNDTMVGGAGNDSYQFGHGSGQDVIQDIDSTVGNLDTIVMAADVNPNNVTLSRVNDDLVFKLNDSTDSVTVSGWFTDDAHKVERVTFSDSTVWDVATMLTKSNRAPVLSVAVANQSATQDQPFAFQIPATTFTDPDVGDSLSYSFKQANGSALPSWLSFNAQTRTLSGQPANADVGNLNLVLTATDTFGLTATDAFNLNVINVNDAPTAVGSVSNQTAVDGSAFSLQLAPSLFNDIDVGDTLTLSVKNADGSPLPSWLTFNANTHTLSGTPAYGNVGNLNLQVTGTDTAGAKANIAFGLQVTPMANQLLVGTSANNTLTTGSGNDTLDGGLGADTMSGGYGNDTYVVDNTGDVIVENANAGTDLVQSSVSYTLSSNVENLTLTGTDSLTATGNDLNNVLIGNTADSTLDGGAGADTMIGGIGSYSYVVDNVNDVIISNDSVDGSAVTSTVSYTLSANLDDLFLDGSDAINGTGNAQDNTIWGNAANNVLTGGAGDDTLYGAGGTDTLIGGTGDDTYEIFSSAEANNVIVENANEGTDTILSSTSYDMTTKAVNVENLTLFSAGSSSGTGNALNNVITGSSGANTLNGGAGIDTLIGGGGNDIYIVDTTTDTITENANEGTDTVQSSVTYSLNTIANVENLTLTGASTINGTGNTLNNALTGNTANNILTGGAGDDTLNGGAGVDTLVGGTGNDTYVVDTTTDTITENAGEGTDTVQSSVTFSLNAIANVENLTLTGTTAINGTGNSLNNVLTGNTAANTLDGGLGNDTIVGGGGEDYVKGGDGNDLLYGGSVTDVANGKVITQLVISAKASLLNDNVAANMLIYADGVLKTTIAVTNTANFQDYVIPTSLFGSTAVHKLDVVFNNDAYITTGGSIQDRNLFLNTININGQTSSVSSVGYIDQSSNGYIDIGTGTGAFDGINVHMGENTLAANAAMRFNLDGNDWIDGGVGVDTMAGGYGNDTYIVDNVSDLIVEQLDAGYDAIQSSVSYDMSQQAVNVEDLTLTGTANLNVIGNAGNNLLVGNSGDNRIDGGAGVDRMVGGLGNDTYVVDNTADLIEEQSNQGTDAVESSVTYTLAANLENLTLTGTSDINGSGNDLNNVITANAGNNLLWGGAGNDTLIGGLGNDTYYIDNANASIVENAGEGNDSIITSVSLDITTLLNQSSILNIENFYLNNANATALNLTGNAINNNLVGNGYNNVLTGGDGNDSLRGKAGADTLDGGLGTDMASYDSSASAVQANLTTGAGKGGDAEGDTYISIESLEGSIYDDLLTGDGGNNTLVGNLGSDILQGMAGNDTLNDLGSSSGGNNVFDGGLGNDTMAGAAGNELFIGGKGNDTITTGTGYDVIAFNSGDGQDVVNASTGADNTISLGGGIDYANLTLSKTNNDLILKTGGTDQITLKDWYAATTNHSVVTLQVVAEVMAGYTQAAAGAGGTTLKDNKIENFNFAGLVSAFDTVRGTNTNYSNWSMTNSLLSNHLADSDTAALGGDLAYQYGKNSNLTGMGLNAAQTAMNDANFGKTAQSLNSPSVWQAELVKLG